MNILFICDEYPPGQHGGIGTMVQVLSRELVKQGHQVSVIGLYPYYYGGENYENDLGVEVYRLRYGLNLGGKSKHFLYKAFGKLPRFIRKNINGKQAFNKLTKKIEELIKEKGIDVIEIQDWNTFTFFIGFNVDWPLFSVPFIVKSNGSYSYFKDEMKLETKDFFKNNDIALYKRADALSSVSKYTESVNRRVFQYTSRVQILYNAIELPNINIDLNKKEKTFIFTGTLIKKKGVWELMRAWNIVNEEHPNAVLKIYGKGKVEELKALLTKEAKSTVKFLGHVTREELFNELSVATAAIFPSYSECFSLAPLEAMAVGCPVINSRLSSGAELVVDKENGALIQPTDIVGMANTIIEMIENKELQKKYSINGLATIHEKFTIEKSAKDHIAFYNEVISDFRRK